VTRSECNRARHCLARHRTTMQIEDKLVSLVPGMAVAVEIKTSSRRVIEYVLSPLLRYKQEAMREMSESLPIPES
jgi:hypothetical protein